jgi:hypothetical protein
MGKVAKIVDAHRDELRSCSESFTSLYKFSRRHEIDNKRAFCVFKDELSMQLGIDYDALRLRSYRKQAALRQEAESLSKATPLVIPPDALVMWRKFCLVSSGGGQHKPGVLGSYHFHKTEYQPQMPMIAICSAKENVHSHIAPHENCDCGIHSAEDLSLIMKNIPYSKQWHDSNAHIYAKLAIWGPMFKTKRGWRSRFAYPIRLYTDQYPELCELFGKTSSLREFAESMGYDPDCIPPAFTLCTF